MKRLNFAILSGLALLCAAAAHAQVIIINWTSFDGTVVSSGYLPRSASDWVYGTIAMYETATKFAGIQYENGNDIFAPTPTTVNWCCGGSPMNGEIGHATSVALANANKYDTAIEVHQGGQDGGAQLWYSLGSGKLGGTLSEQIPYTLNWATSQKYGTGFNPTVAVDNSNYLSSPTSAAVVEVHQASSDRSDLWYTFGLLLGINGASPVLDWFPAVKIPSVSGYAPSVSLASGLAVVVFQGASGELFYSIGVNDTFGGFTWSAPVYYTQGYNPSIAVYGCATCKSWTVLEAHQANNGTGALWYRTGLINKQGTHSIVWTPDGDTMYEQSGCYPSVAQNGVYVWETHEYKCGEASPVFSSFGQLVYY